MGSASCEIEIDAMPGRSSRHRTVTLRRRRAWLSWTGHDRKPVQVASSGFPRSVRSATIAVNGTTRR